MIFLMSFSGNLVLFEFSNFGTVEKKLQVILPFGANPNRYEYNHPNSKLL